MQYVNPRKDKRKHLRFFISFNFTVYLSRRVFSTPEELLSCPSYMLVSESPPSSTTSSASTSPSFARRHPPQSHHGRSQQHHGSRHRYYSSSASHSSRQSQPSQGTQSGGAACSNLSEQEGGSIPQPDGNVESAETREDNPSVPQSSSQSAATDSETDRNVNKEKQQDNAN